MKTHYRKVFKSDHLGIADLEEFIEEGKSLIFTIKEVKQYILESGSRNSGVVVAGKRISANIAYFVEDIKPLVLNSTNSKTVKEFNDGSHFVEDWSNTKVELFINASVKMKGETVGGVRIRKPIIKLPDLNPEHPKWNAAKKSVEEKTYTVEALKEWYTITPNNEKLLCKSSE